MSRLVILTELTWKSYYVIAQQILSSSPVFADVGYKVQCRLYAKDYKSKI